MGSDAYAVARERYLVAYEAYRAYALHVMQELENGVVPSSDGMAAEARAIDELTTARRELLDLITTLSALRH